MKLLLILLSVLIVALVAHAQLAVAVSPPKIAGQKAIVPLLLSNRLGERVESARAVMFLLDSGGKVAGQDSHWIIGGDPNHPPTGRRRHEHLPFRHSHRGQGLRHQSPHRHFPEADKWQKSKSCDRC